MDIAFQKTRARIQAKARRQSIAADSDYTANAAIELLSDFLGGPNIWIKRDDATHISSGGNKLRKLDRVLHSAAEQGADCLVSGGVPQSNSQRQVATAAAMLGLEAQGRVSALLLFPTASQMPWGPYPIARLFRK